MTEEDKNKPELGEDMDANAGFDDFEAGSGGSLGDMWRTNPLIKVGIVVGLVVMLVGGFILFGGKPETAIMSNVKSAPDVKEPPGTNEVTPAYANAVAETNAKAAEDAMRTGTSAIPVPISSPKNSITLPSDSTAAEDPLARWRRIQEERTRRDAANKKPDIQQADPNDAVVKSLAEAMSKQMESVLKNQQASGPKYKLITDPQKFAEERQKQIDDAKQAAKKDAEEAKQTEDAAHPKEHVVDILQPAGEIQYAQLINQANTDAPGPVLAEIISGPLAGSRALGSFRALDDYVVLTFDTVVIDGISYPINAVALDPDTANPGLATDVDHRYFSRVILPAASSFIEGLGSAIADSGNTNVTVDGSTVVSSTNKLDVKQQLFKGVESGASKLGEIFDQDGSSKRTLITVAAGTPMGLLFIDPVTKDSAKTR